MVTLASAMPSPDTGQLSWQEAVPRTMPLTGKNSGGAEGIRTPDPLDANEVRYRTALQPQDREPA
jgi:hypothetical protein